MRKLCVGNNLAINLRLVNPPKKKTTSSEGSKNIKLLKISFKGADRKLRACSKLSNCSSYTFEALHDLNRVRLKST